MLHLRYSLVAGLDYSRFQSSVSIHSAILRYLTVSHTVPELAVVWYNEPAHRLFEPIITARCMGTAAWLHWLGPTQCHGNSRSEDGDRRGRRCYSTLVRLTHSAPPHCLQPLGSFLLDLRGRFRLEHHAHLGATAWWLK